MVATLLEVLKHQLRGRWLAVLVTAVLVYFGYHALHGHRGLLAWIDTSRDLEAARQELAKLRAERAELQRQIQAFQQDSIDRDLLEEELRKLGYVKPNEVIILRHDDKQPGTSG
ncbi:FtsB family cell division protein [Benzoatithermus flavus]|uniref:Septum formation initiator family protein n=1 Tax=Benzoatithermus flavus TaxID=3108223 RepID=A0ABU8XK18_9PROT